MSGTAGVFAYVLYILPPPRYKREDISTNKSKT